MAGDLVDESHEPSPPSPSDVSSSKESKSWGMGKKLKGLKGKLGKGAKEKRGDWTAVVALLLWPVHGASCMASRPTGAWFLAHSKRRQLGRPQFAYRGRTPRAPSGLVVCVAVSARCTAWQGDELLHDDSLGDARQQVHARRSALGVMLSAHGRF